MQKVFVLFSVVVSLFCSGAWADGLKVSTFNIRWYGLGGTKEGSPEKETRDRALKSFFRRELSKSDVVAFEEIVDVARLKSEVVGDEFKCASYAHEDPLHQHVVICYRGDYTLSREDDADAYALKGVALGKYRPAVVGLLRDADGRPVAHLVAVHLKSGPDFRTTRLRQARLLARHIKSLRDDVPVVVTGDFNTYASDAGRDEDDIAEILGSLDLAQVHNPAHNTYRSPRFAGRFDHVFATADLARSVTATMTGPCDSRSMDDIVEYYRTISDHCPLTVELNQ